MPNVVSSGKPSKSGRPKNIQGNQDVILSVPVTAELRNELDEFAKEIDRTRAWVIRQALKRYLDEESGVAARRREKIAEQEYEAEAAAQAHRGGGPDGDETEIDPANETEREAEKREG